MKMLMCKLFVIWEGIVIYFLVFLISYLFSKLYNDSQYQT